MSQTVSEELLESLKDLQSAAEEEDFVKVVEILKDDSSTSLLQSAKDDDDLLQSLYEIYVKSLLHLQEYNKVVTLIDKQVPAAVKTHLQRVKLYALYRLKECEQAISKEGSDDKLSKLIQAQALYHLAKTQKATDLYQQLLEDAHDDDDERMQILTNLAAVQAANATPYVRSKDESALKQQIEQFLSSSDSDEYPYDLATNLASWELTTSARQQAHWNELLQTAQKACTAMGETEGLSTQDIEKEMAPIQTNQHWSRLLWSGNLDASAFPLSKNLTAATKTVRLINRALALNSPADSLKLFPKEDDTNNMVPLQKRICYYDTAVLQLRAGQFDACRQSCDKLLQSLKGVSKSKKKRQQESNTHIPHLPTVCEEDTVWWESRVAVLQAYCLAKEDKNDEAMAQLTSILEVLREMPTSPIRDHALCFAQLHKAAIDDNESTDTIQLLKDMPESLQSRRAVVAMLASIYHNQGKEQQAVELLKATGDDQVFADYAMSQGNYEEAAALYEKAVSDDNKDPIATARYVQALSHTDPAKAQKIWSQVSPDLVPEEDNDEEVNGAELEERELPRLKTSKARKTEAVPVDEKSQKATKSHDAVLRRRARKREQYLTELEKKGLYRPDRPTKPDPERWLPKYERSHSRRRRNRAGPHKGAQGGVSEKDASKLDVYARQAARASGEPDASGPSTAHMKAISTHGPRKGGRRR